MQVGNQPAADWIRSDGKDHGQGGGCGLRCKRSNIAADCNDNCNLPADEISGQCSEPVVISLRPAVFDRYVAAFDKTGAIQPCRMTAIRSASVARERLLRIPITGTCCCCARAASGQAAAAPPSSVMNSRRLIAAPSLKKLQLACVGLTANLENECPLWVKRDMCSAKVYVRFTPESGHVHRTSGMSAKCQ